MKCRYCPALLQEGYEYPEKYCGLSEEEREFSDGENGCNRKNIEKIKKDLEIAIKLENEAFADDCGKMVDFFK